MRRRPLLRFGVVALLLGLGLLVAYLQQSPSEPPVEGLQAVWLERHTDLLVQLGLMLTGALGIRALLPDDQEDEETDVPIL